jgi:hypothetical protein
MITIEDLTKTPIPALDAKLNNFDLIRLDDELSKAEAAVKAQRANYHAVLVRRFGEQVRKALTEKGEDTGTVTLPATNSTELSVNIPKTVDWDQQLLTAALNGLPAEEARHYAKVAVSISEENFKAAPPKLRDLFLPARTVKPGKMKFTFKPSKEAA